MVEFPHVVADRNGDRLPSFAPRSSSISTYYVTKNTCGLHNLYIYIYIYSFFLFSFSSFFGSQRADRQYISEFTIHIVICSRRRKNWIGSLPSIHCCFGGLCASLSPFLALCCMFSPIHSHSVAIVRLLLLRQNLLYIIKNTFSFWTQITCSHSRTTHICIDRERKGVLHNRPSLAWIAASDRSPNIHGQ